MSRMNGAGEAFGAYGSHDPYLPYGPYGPRGADDSGPPAAPPGGGWPANDLEEVLSAALGDPGATPRVVEVLGRSQVWVPLPSGGPSADPSGDRTPDPSVDLPGMQLHGLPYVPVFSSEEQFRRAAPGMPYAVMPARDFARGLPPGVGMAVNPGGAVGIPLPAVAVEDLCRSGAGGGDGGPLKGGRVRLWEPDPDDEPVDFLAAAAGEFAITPVVLSARRALGSVEGERPTLFIGVELDRWQEEDRAAAMDALGRALGAESVPWAVNLLLLDVAQDPLADLMHDRISPFFSRD
ncbi:enhanced serine sensitivity protein SseB [Streptomyces sp. RB6PN25]|uniref:Enhanced serine sensitivity protein SseB n=1 Tax=Streptomyces humicola TaxID=2953240 RepID=A0ABT1Q311_9ACTN|nr:enhanced serine sensitivity protein SseB [Streptomyces humicola]MCQ4084317.1 enhanced serine sensitivity protein SseB [Streptomyces humicola]